MWKYVLLILGLLYILSPFDILPDWFLGWGWLDDGVIAVLAVRFLLDLFKRPAASTQSTADRHSSAEYESARDHGRDSRTGERDQDKDNWDPFKVLSVDPDASADEIKKAYLRLANKYHPDKVTHLGQEFRDLAENKFKEIQRAYRELRQ